MNKIRRHLTALALVLVAACASPTQARASFERKPVAEEWYIVLPMQVMEEALAARKAEPTFIMKTTRLPPGIMMLSSVEASLAAMPKLDRHVVHAAMMVELLRLFEHLPIKINVVRSLPAEAASRRVVLVGTRHPTQPTLMGKADGIDTLNKRNTHKLLAFLDSLIDEMRTDRGRFADPVAPSEISIAAPVTSTEAGTALGLLIAHEIGHSLGCRHNVRETQMDLTTVMMQGAAKYRRASLGLARFHYTTKVYLWAMLNRVELPKWIVAKYDHEQGDSSECKQCGG